MKMKWQQLIWMASSSSLFDIRSCSQTNSRGAFIFCLQEQRERERERDIFGNSRLIKDLFLINLHQTPSWSSSYFGESRVKVYKQQLKQNQLRNDIGKPLLFIIRLWSKNRHEEFNLRNPFPAIYKSLLTLDN